jgi:uncharacterized protein YceK
MRRYLLLIIYVILSGCASFKHLDASSLIGAWESKEKGLYAATYEFRKDGSGSYEYLNHDNNCTMSYEFSWSVKGSRVSIVGYLGMEIDGMYGEVILHEKIKPVYEQGKLIRLKPENANRYFSKSLTSGSI